MLFYSIILYYDIQIGATTAWISIIDDKFFQRKDELANVRLSGGNSKYTTLLR